MINKLSKKKLNKDGKKKVSKCIKKSFRRNIKRQNLTKKMRGGAGLSYSQRPTAEQRKELLKKAMTEFYASDVPLRENSNIFNSELVESDSGMGSSNNSNIPFIQSKISRGRAFKKRSIKSINDTDTIKHMWYPNWPDHGTPEMGLFKTFIKNIETDINKDGGNTLIHCSAGIGRTGVVYIILYILFTIDISDRPSLTTDYIRTQVINARMHRDGMVQTFDQFLFICKYFEIKIPTDPTSFEYKTLKFKFDEIKIYTTLITKNKSSKTNSNEGKDKSEGLLCPLKNRYSNIIPTNKYRVKLKTFNNSDPNCNDYINASQMKPITNNKDILVEIITAQCPTDNTIKDFYQMLKDETITRIIMLTNITDTFQGKLKCEDYFGSTLNIGDQIPSEYIGKIKYIKSIESVVWGEIRLISSKPTVLLSTKYDDEEL